MRTTIALVIEPTGRCRLVDLLWDEDSGALEQRRELVGGGIEGFMLGGSPGAMYYLNGDSKFTIGPPGFNKVATDVARSRLDPRDWICGPALVVGMGAYGHDSDVPQWVIDKVKSSPDCDWQEHP